MLAQIFFAQHHPFEAAPGKEIASQYRRWDAAYLSRDVRVAGDVLSREFKIVTGGGSETDKATYLVRFRASDSPSEYETKLLRLSNSSRRAKVWTRETSDHEVHYYLDSWVMERGEWRLVSSKTLREEGH